MKTRTIATFTLAFFALFVFAGLANAAAQISSYTVTPTTLKPGSTGSFNLNINNPSSTEYIYGAYISGSGAYLAFTNGVSAGDLGGLGSTMVSLPFTISSAAKPGSYVATLTMSYGTSAGSGSASQFKSFSIPYTVSGVSGLEAKYISSTKNSVSPGESFIATIEFENKGDDVNNLIITTASTSSFALDGASQVFIGSVKSGEKKSVDVQLKALSTATAGKQLLSIALAYDNVNGASFEETASAGAMLVTGSAPKVSVSLSAANAFPGKNAVLTISIKNEGEEAIHNVRVSMPEVTSFLTPLDYSEKNIGTIEPGEQVSATFSAGINADVTSKYYALDITVSYDGLAGSTSVTKKAGLEIAAATKIDVIASTSPTPVSAKQGAYSLSIQASNTGDTAIRALSIKVSSDAFEFTSGDTGYIGTVNVDDYSTVSFNAITKQGIKEGMHSVEVTLEYKDTFNVAHSEKKLATIVVVSPEKAAMAAAPKTAATAGDGTGTLTIIIVIILAAGGYVGYKKFFKKKGAKANVKSL